MDLTLYGFKKTRSVRPQWLLEELGLNYQFIEVNIFKGEGFSKKYRAIHPHGQLPALKINEQVIFESGAICHWLADQFPQSSCNTQAKEKQTFAPAYNDPLRAEYEQWMFYISATLEPPVWHYMLHTRILPKEKRIEAVANWNKGQYLKLLKTLNHLLKGKQYLLGQDFSAADIMLAYLLFWFPEFLIQFPVLKNYSDHLEKREAYQNLHFSKSLL